MPYRVEVVFCDLLLERGFLSTEELDLCLRRTEEAPGTPLHQVALDQAFLTETQVRRLYGEVLQRLDEKHRVIPARPQSCPRCDWSSGVRFHNSFRQFFCPACLTLVSVEQTGEATQLEADPLGGALDLAVDERKHELEFAGIPDRWIEREVAGYRVVCKLGVGGMGTIYKVVDGQGQPYAVKILADWLLAQDSHERRFLREARLLSDLDHPNIRKLYEVLEVDGQYLMRMEFVRGESLESILDKCGSLEWRQALRTTAEIAQGLQHAHEKRVLHRDVKPHNILVAVDGGVKLCDFGIAVSMETLSQLTRPGQWLGTAGYISPELIEGTPLDGRADIYSLGVTLHKMLTGEQPFRADNLPALVVQMLSRPTPSPSDIRPDLPQPVCRLTRRMMNRERDGRHSSMAELIAEIDAILRGETAAVEERPSTWVSLEQFDACREVQQQALKRFGAKLPLEEILFQRGLVSSVEGRGFGGAVVVKPYRCAGCGADQPLIEAFRLSFSCSCGGVLQYAQDIVFRKSGLQVLVEVQRDGLRTLIQGHELLEHLRWLAKLGASEIALFLGHAGHVPVAHAGWLVELARDYRDRCVLSVVFDNSRLLDAFSALGFDQFVRVYHSSRFYARQQVVGVVDLGALSDERSPLERRGGWPPVRSSPLRPSIRRELFYHYEDGDYAGAIELANQMLHDDPEDAQAFYYRGVCHYRLRNYEQAVFDLDQGLQRAPDDVHLRFFLGHVFLKTNRFDQAVAEYERVLVLQPDHVKAWARRGTAHYLAGRLREAHEDFEIALDLNPQYARALFGLGRIHLDREQWPEAESRFREALSASPAFANAQFYLACCCACGGREDEMFEHLGQALALGFESKIRMREEPALQAWQDHPRFRNLAAGLH